MTLPAGRSVSICTKSTGHLEEAVLQVLVTLDVFWAERVNLQEKYDDPYDASLLPLATQRSEAALASYRAGSGPLSAVLDARRGELEVRMERLRIEMDRARIWAQLNYLLPSHDGAQGKPEALQ